METIIASEFKAKCLKLMDKVARTGEGIIITKNGVPTAQLKPINKISSLFGVMAEALPANFVMPDLLSTPLVKWKAMKGDSLAEEVARTARKRKKK